jgi:hypothetical protein
MPLFFFPVIGEQILDIKSVCVCEREREREWERERERERETL